MDIVSIFGVSAAVVATIVGAVELVKFYAGDAIRKAVPNPRTQNLIWIGMVLVLAAGTAVGVNRVGDLPPVALVLMIPAYWVSALGAYAGGKSVFGLKKPDEPAAPSATPSGA